MSLFFSLITSRLAGPVATGLALIFAGLFVWQSARIDGWPLIGGGLEAQMAGMTQQLDARQLADARAQAAALTARQRQADAAEDQARAHAASLADTESQIRTIIRKVPIYVSQANDNRCVVPWGAVRLLDAAASGADPDSASARIAPGQPDDAASDVGLSEAVALLAADLGVARENADQLNHLEAAVRAQAISADVSSLRK